MTDKELFHETFSQLHASDTLYEEVLEMTENRRKRRRSYHMLPKAAVVCALTVALGGITVFAAAHGEFFQSIFGTKGQENVEVHEVEMDGQSWTAPAREWETADERTAERLTGEHITQIGESVTVYGYTLTVDEYLIDENGIGAVTYTLSNPDGLAGVCYAGYGEYYMSPDVPMKEINMMSAGEKSFDLRSIVDQTQTTDTELHAVMYFVPIEKLDEGEAIQIIHSGYETDESGKTVTTEEQRITFTPDSFVSSDTYTSESGFTAHVSPVGILFDGPVFESTDSGWITQKLIITYTDGSIYQVEDTDVYNTIVACYNMDGDVLEVFNRLVDTEKIASVTVNGPDGEDLVFTK